MNYTSINLKKKKKQKNKNPRCCLQDTAKQRDVERSKLKDGKKKNRPFKHQTKERQRLTDTENRLIVARGEVGAREGLGVCS